MTERVFAPQRAGFGRQLRLTFFPNPISALVSIVLAIALACALVALLRWGVFNAVFHPDAPACAASDGACWGAVVAKARLILLGRFPAGQQWRPVLGSVLLLGCIGFAAHPRGFNRIGLAALAAGLVAFGALMAGGFGGLAPVGTDLWGGLPLTLFLALVACLLSMPLGVALALGRRSKLPVLRWMATAYIEGIRGIPLITLLFFGAFVLPLVLPDSWRIDTMLRIAACLTMFCAAYLAEVFRGGLQAIKQGQIEAAHALSLSRWQTLTRVVLPQALRITIAPIASLLIGTVKDTSLVMIVNVYDLTGSLKLALADSEWQRYSIELYLMVSAIYLTIGLSIATYGRYLERRYAPKTT